MPMDDGTTSADQSSSDQSGANQMLFVGAERAFVGGLLAVAIAGGGQLLIGQIYTGSEAGQLLEAVIPSARTLGSSVITATGTILALMLTMLGLTHNAQTNFDSRFYKRVERIGLLSSIALSGAILLLLILNIPIQESNVPTTWYEILYYVLISISAGLAGLLVAIVLMLYNAMTSLLKAISPLNMPDVRDPLVEQAQSDDGTRQEAERSSAPTPRNE